MNQQLNVTVQVFPTDCLWQCLITGVACAHLQLLKLIIKYYNTNNSTSHCVCCPSDLLLQH